MIDVLFSRAPNRAARGTIHRWFTIILVAAAGVLAAPVARADDVDGDGIDGAIDDCPAVWNPLQADCNHDGVGDACNDDGAVGVDVDQDGLCDPVDNCAARANVDQGDCDGDGTGDLCEAAAGQRDDDRDGVCNATDPCPREPGACPMKAITVPWVPANPTIAHPTYSGATHTLKGIARYGGTQYRWDFGDGSAATAWINIANPYNLGVDHVYTGAVGQIFIATLSVRDAGGTVASAVYPVKIADSGPLPAGFPYAMEPNRMDVRIDMAIDQGLWWLHTNMSRSTYGDGAPGYAQPYGYWSGVLAGTCAALDAFELHGSKPHKDYATDPYVETVHRALNHVLYNATRATISTQTHGRPDYDLDGYGVYFGANDTYTNGICGVAFASSGAPARQALVGGDATYGRTYRQIAQAMAEWFAYGQTDSGTWRGGWRYSANSGQADGSTNQWPLLAISAAEDNMAITTPAFVRSEAPYFMTQSRHADLDNRNGGWGYMYSTDYVNHVKTAAGILYHDFMGDSTSHPEVQAALGFLYRYWALDNYDGGASWNIGLGNSYAMYGIMKAMRMPEPDILRVVQYDYLAGAQTANSFDWYYTPPGQTQEGLATNLVRRQAAAGNWSDTIGSNAQSGALATGWDVLILSKGVTIIPPEAMICDCTLTWDNHQDITLDGSCSTHPDGNRHIVAWEWDFLYDGSFEVGATGQHGTLVGGYDSYGAHPVALRVTDDNPVALGGPQTSLATCSIVTKPPNNCPHPSADGPYLATHEVPFALDASASFDPDGDTLVFAWDLDNDGLFDDAAGANPTVVFATLGTFAIAVQVTDVRNDGGATQPCSRVAFSTVEVGNHAPVADPDGPYAARPGQTILLDGTGSYDPDGDVITFGWDLDNDGVFTDSASPIPPFTVPGGAPVGTVYDVCLRVTDELGRVSATACTTVTVQELDTPPTCTQPQPAIVAACTGGDVSVTVDGSLSQDPDGDPLTFAWTTDCPGGWFADPTAALTTLTLASGGACSATCTATLTVTGAGASADCARLIDIVDGEAPSFVTAPADATFECNPAAPAAVEAWLASAAAVDACTSAELASDFVGLGGGCGGATGAAVVTWTATDACGNPAQTAATLAVVDTVAPALWCPAPATLECTGPLTPVALVAGADDACFGALAADGPFAADYPVGVTSVEFTAEDPCGNPGACASTVTITDTTPPVFDPATLGPHTVLGDCSGAAVTFPLPAATDLCQAVTVTCAPLAGDLPGAHPVTCTATDASGNSTTATVTVTVLAPLRLAFVSPLEDDNVADDPATDADRVNMFKVGSTVPHQLRVYACSGADVTRAIAGQVTLRLAETYRTGAGTGDTAIVPSYSGSGAPGGVLVLAGNHWKYNLDTDRASYPAGTIGGPAYFQSLVTATYDSAPAIVAGREDARLESR